MWEHKQQSRFARCTLSIGYVGKVTDSRYRCSDIVVPFCPKKVGTDISRIFSVLQPDSKNLVPFCQKKLGQTKPAYSRGISSIVPFVPLFFINLCVREKKKEKSVYKKKFVEKTGTIGTTAFFGREYAGKQRPILPKKVGTKLGQLGQNMDICLRAPLFPCVLRFFLHAISAHIWRETASDKLLTCHDAQDCQVHCEKKLKKISSDFR